MPFPYNEQCDLSVFYKNYEYSIFYLFNLFKYAKMCIKFQVWTVMSYIFFQKCSFAEI